VTVAADLAGTAIAREQADRVLHETGLAAAAERRVGGFSRGMTQRLALATTLVTDPAIVILDEPSAALDPAGRHEVLDLVAHLGRDRTVLLSSHILADVQRVCDTVGVLIDGRLRYQGPLSRLLAEHVLPAWNVRVRGDPTAVIAALESRDWVQHVSAVRDGQVRVEVTSFQAGERYLVPALADVGVPVIAVEPAADDLDDAFLRLTGAVSPPEEVTG
jgi:ABC-2 type transport system ATP-binding protein